jgi:lysophospholipase L1-like esterase
MSLHSAQPIKTVHLIPKDSAIKRLCFDDETQMLRPNLVLVDLKGSVVFEINELGLKGAARDPARQLAVVWGDSVVFGVRWSWPCLLDELAPRYQFLNGGIEADPYHNVLRRAAAFNRTHAVALNIVMLGWHPIPPPPHLDAWQPGFGARLRGLAANLTRRRPAPLPIGAAQHGQHRQLRTDLLAFLQTTPNAVLVTMPTALNRKIADRDLSSQFIRGTRDTVFSFAGDISYSLELQRYLFDHITERNAIIRELAREAGVRLVDLAAEFDTEQLDDFRQHFHDVLHLRPLAYPKAAAAIYDGIKDLL